MNVSFKTQFSLFGETSVDNLIAVKQDLYLSLNLFSAMRVMSYALFSTIKVTVYNCNVLFLYTCMYTIPFNTEINNVPSLGLHWAHYEIILRDS